MKVSQSGLVNYYKVNFGPNVAEDDEDEKKDVMRSIKGNLEQALGRFFFHDNYVYSQRDIVEPMVFNANTMKAGLIEIKVEKSGVLDLSERVNVNSPHVHSVLAFINNLIRFVLKEENYNQVGRFPKFFHPQQKVRVENYDLQAWPGFNLESTVTTIGFFNKIDSCTKFINTVSILDQIKA